MSDELASKVEATVELEDKIVALQALLETALADVETNKGLVGQLAEEKSGLEVQLTETNKVMSRLQSEQQAGEPVLASLREDVGFFPNVVPKSIFSCLFFTACRLRNCCKQPERARSEPSCPSPSPKKGDFVL